MRREQDVDAFALEPAAIRFERARIAVEVLVRPELQPVDEDAGDDAVAVRARDAHQREMALVQVAHRRHERHLVGAREPLAQRFRGFNQIHRAPSCNAERIPIMPGRG